jgi:hypothetical protein
MGEIPPDNRRYQPGFHFFFPETLIGTMIDFLKLTLRPVDSEKEFKMALR